MHEVIAGYNTRKQVEDDKSDVTSSMEKEGVKGIGGSGPEARSGEVKGDMGGIDQVLAKTLCLKVGTERVVQQAVVKLPDTAVQVRGVG